MLVIRFLVEGLVFGRSRVPLSLRFFGILYSALVLEGRALLRFIGSLNSFGGGLGSLGGLVLIHPEYLEEL